MQALDCPDGSQWTPSRAESVTPLQALALMNHPFLIRQAEHIADRTANDSSELSERMDRIVRLILNRGPTPEELAALGGYAREHGLANACRVLLNCNEFHFIR